tara:strand:- start:56 stop:634 length:579 start_codon:yes stop_codon:yes gene_type:complete
MFRKIITVNKASLALVVSSLLICCNNFKNESDKDIQKVIEDTLEQRNNESLNKDNTSQDHKHSKHFEFKDYKELNITDTISIDLNGNGITELIYFDQRGCPKLIIQEIGQDLISLGCGNLDYKGLPKAMDWVNLWCIVYDKETYEVIMNNGEIEAERMVKMESPGIYIGREEGGGGIITYKDGGLYWIHQAD